MSYATRGQDPMVRQANDDDHPPMSTTPAPEVPQNPPPERPVPGRPLDDPPLPGKDNPVIAPGSDKNPLQRSLASALVTAALVLVAACGRETSPDAPLGEPASTTSSAPTSTDPNAGAVDPESPEAGLNSKRPDGTEDVAPGSDTGAGTGAGTGTRTP